MGCGGKAWVFANASSSAKPRLERIAWGWEEDIVPSAIETL